MVRLFVALRPPPAIRDMLADAMDGVPQARWQDDEQLHLTLRFIGEVDRPVAEDIAAALGQVHAPAPRLQEMLRPMGLLIPESKIRFQTFKLSLRWNLT